MTKILTITDENRDELILHSLGGLIGLQNIITSLRAELSDKKNEANDVAIIITASICLEVENVIQRGVQELNTGKSSNI